jgi:hypothetical protein
MEFAMTINKINIKFFFTGADVNLPAFVPVFHRWIQEQALEGLPIDVADYKHVPNGPGIMLIGYETDYAVDLGDGRPGFVTSRKRDWPDDDLADRLRLTIRQAITAAHLVEEAPSLDVDLDTSEWLITFADRLHAPNTAETFESFRPMVQAVVSEWLGNDVELAWENEEGRRPFAIRVRGIGNW